MAQLPAVMWRNDPLVARRTAEDQKATLATKLTLLVNLSHATAVQLVDAEDLLCVVKARGDIRTVTRRRNDPVVARAKAQSLQGPACSDSLWDRITKFIGSGGVKNGDSPSTCLLLHAMQG